MDGGKKVWVPHPIEGFKLGRIVDIGSDTITVEPFDAPGTVSRIFTVMYYIYIYTCSVLGGFFFLFCGIPYMA